MVNFNLIFKNRNFLFLWIGQIVSQLGDRIDQMALIAFVTLRIPGSALAVAKILSFTIIPVFLIGPIAGVYVDRWDRRRTMYVCDFLRTALVFAIPFFLFYSAHLSFIYILVFLAFCIGRFFVVAKFSIIPQLVKKEELLLANSMVNVTGMIAAILGFGLGGVIVEWVGAKNGFYIDSLSFLISGTLIFLISTNGRAKVSFKPQAIKEATLVGKEMVGRIGKSVFTEIKEGIIYFFKQKEIRFIAGILFLLWSALGSVYTVLIVFVQQTLQSTTKDLGLLIMFLGIGLFAGSLIYGRYGTKLSQYKAIFSSLILGGVMLIVFAVAISSRPDFTLAAALAFLFGMSVSPIMVASNTLIHNISRDEMMGKTFSSLEMVIHLGFLLFMFISSIISEHVSKVLILVIVGVFFTCLGAANLVFFNKISWLNREKAKIF
ncbi:MAG: MFS transporter [Candidatus Omnitrophica bacterium]|nr:MFS transporter [Candidatus Omnitrophota bacterium]MDD5236493.1 MFS transporter [Candidatus Omnitrophota bacterium]MDD5610621.1 MFS transporter [Candidatus Omnitrophota bacterium]